MSCIAAGLLATLSLMAVTGVACADSSYDSPFFFVEPFDTDVIESGKWVKSSVEKYLDQKVFVRPSSKAAEGFEEDKGLRLADEMRHYGIGTVFDKPLTSDKGDLVIQYEVKLEEGLNCGGAYLKLLREPSHDASSGSSESDSKFSMTNLDNDSPFSIMFGPDHCGSGNNRVHFILQHQHQNGDSVHVEKFFNDTPPVELDSSTHLYTLALRADNSVEFFVDMESSKKGSLFTHLKPPLNPPLEIDDPTDVKPADWVDEPTYPDPSAVKPDDWDDEAPARIPDPAAVKPATWDDNVPEMIADPESSRPEDWDDEEDGEWEAPMIRNPLCDTTGCGVWTPSMVKNPAYRGGKWKPPMVPNPNYKGVWKPRQIPNPDKSYDDKPLENMSPIIGIAVEVWTTVGGIHLDNVIIARNLKDAFEYAKTTFLPKAKAEKVAEETFLAEQKEKRRREKLSSGKWMDYFEVYAAEVADQLSDSPQAIAIVVGITLATIAISTYLLFGWGREVNPDEVIDTAEDENDGNGEKDEKKQ